METIPQMLPWLGTVLGTVFGWILNRKVNQAKSKKEIHDTFKKMYEDVSESLLTLQNENRKLHDNINELLEKDALTRRALNRLTRAIEAIPTCDYHGQCPVLSELRLDEDGRQDGEGKPGEGAAAARDKTTAGRHGRHRGSRDKPNKATVDSPSEPTGGG